MVSRNSYINITLLQLFPPFGTFKCALIPQRFDNGACDPTETAMSTSRAIIEVLFLFHMILSSEYCHKKDGIYACAFAEQKEQSIISCSS